MNHQPTAAEVICVYSAAGGTQPCSMKIMKLINFNDEQVFLHQRQHFNHSICNYSPSLGFLNSITALNYYQTLIKAARLTESRSLYGDWVD